MRKRLMKYALCIGVWILAAVNPAWCEDIDTTESIISGEPEFLRNIETLTLDSVTFAGIDSVLSGELDSIILSKPGGPLNDGLVEHDVEALTEFLRKQGWWNAQAEAFADTLDGGSATLKYSISTGLPVMFGRFSTQFDDPAPGFPDIPEFDFSGKPFTGSILEQAVNDIISRFTAEGYPDISAEPYLTAHGDTVDVLVTLRAGKRAVIDTVIIYGLSRTKEYVIRRELRHLSGQEAGRTTTDAARAVIGKLNYVRLEENPFIDYTENGKCTMVINLDEGRQGSFEGVLGYQPATGSESGEMVGKIDLAFPNIMGTGRSSQIRWENLGKDTEDLDVHYLEPWVFGRPYSVSGSFAQEQRERLDYTKTIFKTAVSRSLGDLRSSLGYVYEKVSSDSLSSSSAHGVDIGITWNRIDNPENPGSGVRYSFLWSRVSKNYRFGTEKSHSLERLEFDLDNFVPAATRQTVAFLVRFRQVNVPSDKLTLSDRYWIGGSTSIRGYREKIFPAVKALWATLEYRLLQGQASRVFAFVDSGYLTNRIRDTRGHSVNKTINRTGYGFGMRIESRAGMLGFDYGLGKGDGIGEGKFHVSLSSSF